LRNLILIGFIASLLAGLATGLGAVLVLFFKKVTAKFLDSALGFAAGVMLSATFFSLLLPAIEKGGILKTVTGFILGVLFVNYADKFIPHKHFVRGEKGPVSSLRKLWLFIFAITIHNFPEGLAVGVGFGDGDIKAGTVLAIGIGLQNIPEGLAVSFPLLREGYKRFPAFLIGLLTGLVEPVGGLLGISLVSLGKFLLPYGLAFAAGAMLFVISEEIIPESHSRGNDRQATMGIIIGFLLMMILDTLLG